MMSSDLLNITAKKEKKIQRPKMILNSNEI